MQPSRLVLWFFVLILIQNTQFLHFGIVMYCSYIYSTII